MKQICGKFIFNLPQPLQSQFISLHFKYCRSTLILRNVSFFCNPFTKNAVASMLILLDDRSNSWRHLFLARASPIALDPFSENPFQARLRIFNELFLWNIIYLLWSRQNKEHLQCRQYTKDIEVSYLRLNRTKWRWHRELLFCSNSNLKLQLYRSLLEKYQPLKLHIYPISYSCRSKCICQVPNISPKIIPPGSSIKLWLRFNSLKV